MLLVLLVLFLYILVFIYFISAIVITSLWLVTSVMSSLFFRRLRFLWWHFSLYTGVKKNQVCFANCFYHNLNLFTLCIYKAQNIAEKYNKIKNSHMCARVVSCFFFFIHKLKCIFACKHVLQCRKKIILLPHRATSHQLHSFATLRNCCK